MANSKKSSLTKYQMKGEVKKQQPKGFLVEERQKLDKNGKPIGKPEIRGAGPMKSTSISAEKFFGKPELRKEIKRVGPEVREGMEEMRQKRKKPVVPFKPKVSTPTGKPNVLSPAKYGGSVGKKKKK
jgi:hypothetical protein